MKRLFVCFSYLPSLISLFGTGCFKQGWGAVWERNLRIFALLVLLIGFAAPSQVKASHAMGTDIAFTCLGGSTYEFTVNFYRDCGGVNAPRTVRINLRSATCGQSFFITLDTIGNNTGKEISPLCPSAINQSTCRGGSLPGSQAYEYTGTYTFNNTQRQCNDWVPSFDLQNRNGLITNLQNPTNNSIFVFANLDPTIIPCNSSPEFTTPPVPFICENQPYCYNHGAFDRDGDSLVYSLINPLDGPAPGNQMNYTGTFTPTYPMCDVNGPSGFQFDAQTGSLCFTPCAGQVGVVTIQVDEYRNGVQIGTTLRDIQIVVLSNCSNVQPDLSPRDVTGLINGTRVDSNSIRACPGVPISFNITAADGNPGDVVSMTSNISTVAPGATFSTVGTNPVTGTVNWTPNGAQQGFFSFTVTVTDDGCPIFGQQIFNFDIFIADQINPTIICPGNQTAAADANCNGILPDYTGLASANDNCDANPTITQSPPREALSRLFLR